MFATNTHSMATSVNHNVGFAQNKAQLFVMSPRTLPDQVIRPYEYNFSDQFVSELIDNRKNGQHLLSTNNQTLAVASAIVPSNTNYHQLNTGIVSDCWTFVLIIDFAGQFGNNAPSGFGTTKTRMLATGFCMNGEPVNPLTMFATTPTANPNCMLQITHHTLVRIDPGAISHGGQNHSLIVAKNDDEITQQNEMMSLNMENSNLFLTTPDVVAESNGIHNPKAGTMMFTGAKPISSFHSGAVAVDKMCNSPRNHLASITIGLDSALDMMDHHAFGPQVHMADQYSQSSSEVFDTTFKSELIGGNEFNLNVNAGLNPHLPVSIGQLDTMFPNLHIQPCDVPKTSQWDVSSQLNVSKNNTISFAISSTISSVAISYGIYEASFGYSSYQKQRFDNGIGFKDPYEVNIFNMITGADEQTMRGAWFGFKHQLETGLFPIIKAFGGEFDLLIHFCSTGETLVNLHYLDDGSFNAPKGFYETTTKLGGLVSPMVSNLSHFQNNASQISGLKDAIKNQFSGGF